MGSTLYMVARPHAQTPVFPRARGVWIGVVATGCVRAEPIVSRISWTALTLEVGKSPTEVTCGRHPRAQVTSVGDLRVRFVVEP